MAKEGKWNIGMGQLCLVGLVFAVATAGYWYSLCRHEAAPSEVVVLGCGRPQLIDFGMVMCVQCRRMRPVMEQAVRELGSDLDVHVLDIRQKKNMELAERFKMRVIPLVVLTDGTGKEIWRHEGFVDFPELSQAVRERLGKDKLK